MNYLTLEEILRALDAIGVSLDTDVYEQCVREQGQFRVHMYLEKIICNYLRVQTRERYKLLEELGVKPPE